MRIAIQGIGLVGGFGCGVDALVDALCTQKVHPKYLPVSTQKGVVNLPVFLADTAPLEKFVSKKSLRRVDHFSQMALLGAFLALQDAGKIDSKDRIGIIISTGYGPAQTTFSFLDSILDYDVTCASPTSFSNSVHNIAATNIAISLGLNGPAITVSQFDTSFQSALITAKAWLEEGRVNGVLLGGVDEYCEMLGYCYYRFCIENVHKNIETIDITRNNIPLGEGAVFFYLTQEKNMRSSYAYIQDIVVGKCFNNKLNDLENSIIIVGCPSCGINKEYDYWVPLQDVMYSFSHLYGIMPVGFAFDMAVASILLKKRQIFSMKHNKLLTRIVVANYQYDTLVEIQSN